MSNTDPTKLLICLQIMIEMIVNGNYGPGAILCLYLHLHVSKANLLSKRANYVIMSLSTSYVSI